MKSAVAILGTALLAGCATAPAPQTPTPATPPPANAASASSAYTPTARELTPPRNRALAAELDAMEKEDAELRQRWMKDRQNLAFRDEARQLSAKHIARLDEIIAEHGWPGISLVGFNGMGQAWLLAQHGNQEFLEKVLPLMYEAVLRLELDEHLYATSLDRVLVRRGQKQMYGTQFTNIADDKCDVLPIEDPENVDERRRRAGLPPVNETLREHCASRR